MASNTPNLNLLKKDPVTDGDDTFNIQTMLNDNWDKIDEAVGEVKEELQDLDIPPASLTQAGITQLSSAIDSPEEDKAATPKAVKVAVEAASAAQITANAANTAATAAQSKADQAFQAGNERKAEVVAALVALGVTASTNDSWDTLISKMATVIKATGNAAISDVLAGKTFSNVSASGLTGTMPNQGAKTITPGTANQTIAAGYHNGSGLVKGDPNLIADNLPKDKTIFGVTGVLERLTTTDKTAIATQITNKGVSASANDTPAQLATKIGQIPVSIKGSIHINFTSAKIPSSQNNRDEVIFTFPAGVSFVSFKPDSTSSFYLMRHEQWRSYFALKDKASNYAYIYNVSVGMYASYLARFTYALFPALGYTELSGGGAGWVLTDTLSDNTEVKFVFGAQLTASGTTYDLPADFGHINGTLYYA
ncbi:phage tail protein [Paenibacillus motobuensis]|uniref:Tail fiber protein n=1 Tax=Paenibacillus motobuensis TaxID=295324 RepID=A0ABP3I7C8_9BACL